MPGGPAIPILHTSCLLYSILTQSPNISYELTEIRVLFLVGAKSEYKNVKIFWASKKLGWLAIMLIVLYYSYVRWNLFFLWLLFYELKIFNFFHFSAPFRKYIFHQRQFMRQECSAWVELIVQWIIIKVFEFWRVHIGIALQQISE